jgi:hypothetical protein
VQKVVTPIVPNKKHARIAKEKHVGRALRAGSFNCLRRRPKQEASSATVPDRKRPSIVVLKVGLHGRKLLRVALIHMKVAPKHEAHHLEPK